MLTTLLRVLKLGTCGYAIAAAMTSKLTDILDFPGNSQPSWIHHRCAYIVVQSLDAHVPFSLDESHEPGSLVACQGTDPATVTSWLEGKTTAGWCIPSTTMGPDLLAILLLDNGETVLMVLQCKCYCDKTGKTKLSTDGFASHFDIVQRITDSNAVPFS